MSLATEAARPPARSRKEYLRPMVREYITDEKDLDRIVREYKNAETIYLDFEDSSLDVHTGVAWLLALNLPGSNIVHVIDCQRVSRCPSLREALHGDPSKYGGITKLKEVLEAAEINGANLTHDLKYLKRYGIYPQKVYDVVIMSRMLSAGLIQDNSLSANTERYLGFPLEKEERSSFAMHPEIVRRMKSPPVWTDAQLDYAATDVFTLEDTIRLQKEAITKADLWATADVENGIVPIVADMEYVGIWVDEEEWLALAAQAAEEKKKFYGEVCDILAEVEDTQTCLFPELTGSDYIINLNSNKIVKQRFDLLGIDVETLEKGELRHIKEPVCAAYIKYKELEKMTGTYGPTWIALKNPITGRIHSSLNQIVDTGRFSSSNPNIQNLPAKKEYRYCFKPRPGYKFVDCDYSSMEMRILAQESGDATLIEGFKQGLDPHSYTAAKMFNVPYEDCCKGGAQEGLRKLGKTLNFAIAYGKGPTTLALDLNLFEELKDEYKAQLTAKKIRRMPSDQQIQKEAVQKAQELLDAYFAAYPDVHAWLQWAAEQPFERGYTKTLLGRKRFFSPIDRLNLPKEKIRAMEASIRNQGKNSPIQGCVVGSTRVFEETRGYVPIRSLVGKSVSIWDGQQFARASVAASGKKRLVKMELYGGHYIECSPNHKFLVRDCVGREKWMEARDLAVSGNLRNLRVVLTDELPDWTCRMEVPKTDIYINNNGVDRCVTDIGDLEAIGEWLGRLAADGGIQDNGVITQLIAKHEECLLPRLTEISGYLGAVVDEQRLPEGNRTQVLHRLRICSRSLYRQLQELGVKERIPDYVFQDSMLLASYLRGLFDGDGTVNRDSATLVFGQGSKHLDWARQVQEGLLLLGIRSRVRSYEGDRTVVQVMKADMPKFCCRVGFMNPEKQARAEAIIADNKYLSPAHGHAQKVKKIEVTDEYVEMYDVVESETHRFMANGLVTHNSNADITKMAMVRIWNKLLDGGYDAKIVNVIHDELLVEVREDQADAVAQIVSHEMIAAAEELIDKVPIEAEPVIADRWEKD